MASVITIKFDHVRTRTMKIGILGGTFDPIHEGHIAIAEHALHAMHLDHVEFIPCFQPPHRDQPIASPEHRFAMVERALKNHPKLTANDIEIKQRGISYTINTIITLQKQHPKNQYYLIVGADAFSQFDTWHSFQKIITAIDIIVLSRHDKKITTPTRVADFLEKNALEKHIHFSTIIPIPISATQIRADIRAGKEKISGLIDEVREYALKNKVY